MLLRGPQEAAAHAVAERRSSKMMHMHHMRVPSFLLKILKQQEIDREEKS
jgi:hypothetical protein